MFTYEENEEGYTVTGFVSNELFKQLLKLNVPSEYNGLPVTKIKDSAFYVRDRNLYQTINIPNSIKEIGAYAFAETRYVSKLNLTAGLEKIGNCAFKNCIFSEIFIPDSVTEIGEYIFYGCRYVKSITAPFIGKNLSDPRSLSYLFSSTPSTLEEVIIGDKCESIYWMPSIKSLTLPRGLKTVIDGGVSATSLYFKGGLSDWLKIDFGAENSITSLYFINEDEYQKVVTVDLTGVTSLKDYAFSGISSLKNVTFDNALNKISKSAFYFCDNLTSITCPDDLLIIEEKAFSNCYSLKDITFNNKLKTIGDNAFYRVNALKEISFPSSLLSIGKCAFQSCINLAELEIPDNVTSFGELAFANCTKLSSATVGKGITSLPKGFQYCTSLTVIHCPSVTEFEETFVGCSSLVRIYADSLSSTNGLDDCEYLEQVIVDEDLSSYYSEDGILYDSSAKTKIIYVPVAKSGAYTVPTSVTEIGEKAFYNCRNLTSIVLHDDITSIGSYAFYNCVNITSINLSSSLTTIGYNAFEGCTKLERVEVPDSVTFIGNGAFNRL